MSERRFTVVPAVPVVGDTRTETWKKAVEEDKRKREEIRQSIQAQAAQKRQMPFICSHCHQQEVTRRGGRCVKCAEMLSRRKIEKEIREERTRTAIAFVSMLAIAAALIFFVTYFVSPLLG